MAFDQPGLVIGFPEREQRALGARILRRLIDEWPRLPVTFNQYRAALITVGHTNRTADVFGTALAVADLILSDGDVDSDSAAEAATQLAIDILPEAEDAATDQQEWLAFVLSSVPPDGPVDDRVTVAELLRRAADPFSAKSEDAQRVLGNCGIKIIRPREQASVIPNAPAGGVGPHYFAVANRHTGLARLHAGSRWAEGVWNQAARDLPDALAAGPTRYGGAQQRGTAIPLALAIGGNEAEDIRQTLPLDAEG